MNIPPIIDDLYEYAEEIRIPKSEADAFFDYHCANGWKMKGGKMMSDWKAALRTWKRNSSKFAQSSGVQPSTTGVRLKLVDLNKISLLAFNRGTATAELAAELRAEWDAPQRVYSWIQSNQIDGTRGRIVDILSGKIGSGYLFVFRSALAVGKTTCAVKVMQHATGIGKRAKYASAISLVTRILDARRMRSDISQTDLMAEYTRPKFLVIDNFNAVQGGSWEVSILREIILSRHDMGNRDTLIIDSRPIYEVELALGDSLINRANQSGGLIELEEGEL